MFLMVIQMLLLNQNQQFMYFIILYQLIYFMVLNLYELLYFNDNNLMQIAFNV